MKRTALLLILALAGCHQTISQRVQVACQIDGVAQPIVVQLVIDFAPYGGIAGGVDNVAVHPLIQQACARFNAKLLSATVIP
jgi:hypothetical protein